MNTQVGTHPALADISTAVEFGAFRLMPHERLLLREGVPVKIGSRALDILIVLAENAGTVVSKRDLMARVWPNINIEESGLRVQMALLRKIIGDSDGGERRHIINVVGRGYCFIGAKTVRSAVSAPANWSRVLPRAGRTVGRSNDVATISGLLRGLASVTLHGAGGIGKTTLAQEVSEELSPEFDDGVCFVDLSVCPSSDAVPETVAAALGLLVRVENPTPNVIDFIRARKTLLVLDGCEHVVDAVARLVERILRRAPDARILVTSREPLRVEGEFVYPLKPLFLPPDNVVMRAADLKRYSATWLFCERAEAGGFRREFSDADAALVVDICRKTSGIALALEMAASRVVTHGLKLTAVELDGHMQLFWRGRRTAPSRHQTLGMMLDWSYRLLDEPERALLRALSCFVGWFTYDEAAGVVSGGDPGELQLGDTLAQLALKSLVAVDNQSAVVRYRLLDATRNYASSKLRESGLVVQISRLHALFYLRLLTEANRADDYDLSTIRPALGNIRAALVWAFSTEGDQAIAVSLSATSAEAFLLLGLALEGQRWVERGLETLQPSDAGTRKEMLLRVNVALAMILTTGTPDRLEEAITRAIALCDAEGSLWNKFLLLSGLHMFRRSRQQLDELPFISQEAASVAEALNSDVARSAAQLMKGIAHHALGQLPQAMEALIIARDYQQSTSSKHYRFHPEADVVIARTLWLQGFPDQARALAVAATDELNESEPVAACHALFWGARAFHWLGDWDIVDAQAARLAHLGTVHGLAPYHRFAMGLRADIQIRRGELTEGTALLRQSLGKLSSADIGVSSPWLICCLAEALEKQGFIDQGLAVMKKINPRPGERSNGFMPEVLRIHGTLLAAAGDVRGAQRLFRLSIKMADAQGALSWRLRTATSLARLLVTFDRAAEAVDLVSTTYGRFTEGFSSRDLSAAADLLQAINPADPR